MHEVIYRATRKDFRIDTFRAGGPGGQHQNKTESAVRITHLESGLSAASRQHRSQAQNFSAAWRVLATKVTAWVRERFEAPRRETKTAGFGSEAVRTYHAVDNRVKDHRTGVTRPYKATLDGDLDPFLVDR